LECTYTDSISINYIQDNKWIDLERAKILVYPNPAKDRFYWKIDMDDQCQLVVEFTDKNGRVLSHQFFKQYSPGEVKEVNIQNFPSGSYVFWVYNLSSQKQFKTVNVIKQE
jgi:hypothetical protein